MANDIDIVVGVTDLATKALENLQSRVRSMSDGSQKAISQLSDSGVAQFKRLSESVAKQGLISPQAVAQLETAINGIGGKIDAAVAKTNSAIDSVSNRIQNTIGTVIRFISTAAKIATVAASFAIVGRSVYGMSTALGIVPQRLQNVVNKANETGRGVTGVVSSFAKYTIAAGATVSLAQNMSRLTSNTTGLVGKMTALAGSAVNVFVLRNAFKKAEDGSTTLVTKIAKVAGTAIAFTVAGKAAIGFGLNLLGLKKKADDVNASLAKVSTTSKAIDSIKLASTAALLPMANLSSKIEDLPKGAASLASVTSGLQSFGSQLGTIGLLLSVPAAIGGGLLAVAAAAGKSERQLTQMTNKLALVEAASKNISIDNVDTGPLRKIAEEAEKTARSIQTVTNVPASKLMSLATSSLARGLDPKQIGDAMKSATGLAEVFGTSLEDGMAKTRAAMDGNFESFEKLIPSLATMATNEEKLAAVSRLASNGLKVMKSESSGLWGTVERLKNGFGNLLADIGQGKTITELFATGLRDIVAPAIEFVDSKLKSFGFDGPALMDTATQVAAGIVASIQTIGGNWDTITERMKLSAELAWVQISESARFFASDTIPWVGQNLVAMLSNSWDRIVQKTRDSFQLMTTASMEYFGLVEKGTTDFQAQQLEADAKKQKGQSVSPAPQRQAGQREQDLQNQLRALDDKLAKSFNDNYKKAFTELQTALNQQNAATKVNLQPAGAAKPKEPEALGTKNQARQSDAFESRILARGPSRDPQLEMVAILKQINGHQAKIAQDRAGRKGQEALVKKTIEIELVGAT